MLKRKALEADSSPSNSKRLKVHESLDSSADDGEEEEQEEEVFRRIWKDFRRRRFGIAKSLNAEEEGAVKNDYVDFNNLNKCQPCLNELVESVQLQEGHPENEHVCVEKAFGIVGRPGFVFVPNPFISVVKEAFWVKKLALEYPASVGSRCNLDSNGNEETALSKGLRWTTLGFHYNWVERTYEEKSRGMFPSELSELANALIAPLGKEIIGETAIINHYKSNTNMGGHKDDAEWTDEAPVVAVSFGNAGIYILGGDSFNDAGRPPPIPMLVRSGDVVILGGPSRMNLHGVPCMLNNTSPKSLMKTLKEDPAGLKLAEYMASRRINVNIRQVTPNKGLLRFAQKFIRK